MWVSLIQSVEGLKRKDHFPEEEILTPDYNMEILPEFLAFPMAFRLYTYVCLYTHIERWMAR